MLQEDGAGTGKRSQSGERGRKACGPVCYFEIMLPEDGSGSAKRSQSGERGRKAFCPVCYFEITLPKDGLGKEKRSQSEERGRQVFCPVCYFQSILQKMERLQRRKVRVGKEGEKHLIQFVTYYEIMLPEDGSGNAKGSGVEK